MIRLVVNADDLGLHRGIDDGIVRAREAGIVTSASLVACGTTAEEAVRRAAAAGIGIGAHLCLTHLPPAAPVSDLPTLAPGGRMRRGWADVTAAIAAGRIAMREIDLELRAQVARARSLGAALDHLDAHQHLHLLPGVFRIVQAIADDEALPLRRPGDVPRGDWLARPAAGLKAAALQTLSTLLGAAPVRSVGVFESGRLDERSLVSVLERLGDGDHELVCHPGLAVGEVPEDPGWRYDWDDELAALTSDRARRVVARRGIQLVTWKDLG